MRIGILTSSRADFGIYIPLLEKLRDDSFFEIKIIAFGTHLSSFYGETIKEIESNNFEVSYKIESMLLTDSPNAIATAIGLTTIKFADFWEKHKQSFDLIFCLGDRYEMFASIMAGLPFQIPFAHIHGGETTLGAIDNVFRHAITLASKYHFVATAVSGQKVAQLTGSNKNIFHVGALGLDNIANQQTLSVEEFKEKWGIDLLKRTVLTTFHPETVALDRNEEYVHELIKVIKVMNNYQFLITMPNADTSGNLIRKHLTSNFSQSDRVFLIENLGSKNYFTAMENCAFLMGNTSSGIIEAASFGKYVINLGDRQQGRAAGINVLNVIIKHQDIIDAIAKIEKASLLTKDNIYDNGGAASKIISILKSPIYEQL